MLSTPPATMQSAPSRADAVGRHRDGLQARRAEAVDGRRRRSTRHAGEQRGLTADVRRAMRAVAEVAVLDEVLVDAGALDGMLDRVGRHRHRRGDVEPAAAGLCQPRSCIGNDNSFTHFADPPLMRPVWTGPHPMCSENPNSGGRKRQETPSIPRRCKVPGFTQRLSFGKAAIAFLSRVIQIQLERIEIGLLAFRTRRLRDRGNAVLIEQPFQRNLRCAGIVLAADRGERRVGSRKALGQRRIGDQRYRFAVRNWRSRV